MSDSADSTESVAGYKTPPKETRFKKGQSGNPKGRPKGAKNNKTVFENLAATLIEGKLPGGNDEITLREGVIAKLASKALAGDTRSMNKFIDTMQSYDNENQAYCREAEFAALDRIFHYRSLAQLKASISFKPHEVKLIAAYLKKADEEFKKFEPQINTLFDKNGFARPEILNKKTNDDKHGEENGDDES